MRKVYFRADADKTIGYGHFIRSLALAEMLRDDFQCFFFTQEPTLYQREQIDKVCELVSLPANESKFDLFLSYLKGGEIVFLDNYFYTSNYQYKIKQKGCKLICLGSNDRHYFSDVLFNFAERESKIFSVEPYTQIKLGLDWIILREPFRNKAISQCERENSIVICFGGTDQLHLTEKFISVIREIDDKSKIILIATDSFGQDRISSLDKVGVECIVNVSAKKIAEIFSTSKCVICSASTVACEALACGTVVICGYYMENQLRMYEYLFSEQYVLGLSDLKDAKSQGMLKQYLINFQDSIHSLKKKSFSDLRSRYISLFRSL